MKPLDERKRRVLELMTLGGLTRKQAAEAVGVQPETVGRWLRDVDFKRQLEAWRAGPSLDAATALQSRRIIIDELARRILNDRSKMSVRDLLHIHDRLVKEPVTPEEEGHDDDTESRPDERELTDEEAERLWAELGDGTQPAEEKASGEPR